MANRGGHHVDAVTERRLKPVYDNLDNGNYKAAIQMADKVLKKHRDLQCAKVLKALALLRISKRAECSDLTQEVMATKPCDEPTLQALSICFREMQKPEQVVELYSTALKACPSNEEFHTHLFMALVRVGDYKRQQQVAKELYKVFPKNPYYFWGVMSTILQALTATDQRLANTMYLPLAEKMVERMVKEGRIEAEAEVNIYLMVLGYLNKHQKAIEVLDSKMGNFLKAEVDACPIRKADLLSKMERWPEANIAYKELLTKRPDNWSFCKQYLKSSLALVASNWSPAPSGENKREDAAYQPDHTVAMVLDFLQGTAAAERRRASEAGCAPARGIFLARLELLQMLTAEESTEVQRLETAATLMRGFFDLFGDRPCCYDDLCQFLPLLKVEEQQGFVQGLLDSVGLEDSKGQINHAKSTKQLYRHLCCLKIARRLGLQDGRPVVERLELARELIGRGQAALAFGEGLLSTDLQYGDEYLLMATHILVDIWEETGSDKYLWRIIAVLEKGLRTSTSCHHMKLLLMRFYCLVGAFGPIPDLYDGLDIKHIQQDTLGYTVSGYVISLGHYNSAKALFNTTLKFFTSNKKDTTEYMITAYKFGTFHKIPEFLTFRRRISNSIHCVQVTVEKLLLELLTDAEIGGNTLHDFIVDMGINPEKDDMKWDEVTDNRDLDVMVSWAPKHRQLSEEDRSASLQAEKAWLKLRQLLLRSLAAAAYLTPGQLPAEAGDGPGSGPARAKSLGALTEELQAHLALAADDPVTRRKYPVQGPPSSRMANYLKCECGTIFVSALRATHRLHDLSTQPEGQESTELQSTIKQHYSNIIDKCTESIKRSRRCLISELGDEKVFDRNVLPEIVALVETLCFVILLAGVNFRILKPMKAAANRKSRKKKGGATATKPPIFQHFKEYVEGVQMVSGGMASAVEDMETTMLHIDLGKLNLTDEEETKNSKEEEKVKEGEEEEEVELLGRAESTVWSRIEKSYQDTAKELQDLLKGKCQFLASLRL